MKNILLLLLLSSCAPLLGYSQTVNDIPIEDINVEYIQIVGRGKLFSTKLTIEIDFGQHDKVFSLKDTQVKDKDGNRMIFNSMVDALNFFSSNGYDFQQAYTITISNQNVYHFLMKKR